MWEDAYLWEHARRWGGEGTQPDPAEAGSDQKSDGFHIQVCHPDIARRRIFYPSFSRGRV